MIADHFSVLAEDVSLRFSGSAQRVAWRLELRSAATREVPFSMGRQAAAVQTQTTPTPGQAGPFELEPVAFGRRLSKPQWIGVPPDSERQFRLNSCEVPLVDDSGILLIATRPPGALRAQLGVDRGQVGPPHREQSGRGAKYTQEHLSARASHGQRRDRLGGAEDSIRSKGRQRCFRWRLGHLSLTSTMADSRLAISRSRSAAVCW